MRAEMGSIRDHLMRELSKLRDSLQQEWPRASSTSRKESTPKPKDKKSGQGKGGEDKGQRRRVTMMTIRLSTRSHPHGRARLKPKTFEPRRDHNPTNASFVMVITGSESAHKGKLLTHS
ncbi:hypothetical protein V6N13_064245 [Hibiscus sabdariffa]